MYNLFTIAMTILQDISSHLTINTLTDCIKQELMRSQQVNNLVKGQGGQKCRVSWLAFLSLSLSSSTQNFCLLFCNINVDWICSRFRNNDYFHQHYLLFSFPTPKRKIYLSQLKSGLIDKLRLTSSKKKSIKNVPNLGLACPSNKLLICYGLNTHQLSERLFYCMRSKKCVGNGMSQLTTLRRNFLRHYKGVRATLHKLCW